MFNARRKSITRNGRRQVSLPIRVAVFLLAAFFCSCASTSSIQNAPLHAGTARTFHASFNKTLKAAREAILEAGLKIEKSMKLDDGSWMIVGKAAASVWSMGELVRVMVTGKTRSATEVKVLTKRRVSIEFTAKGDYAQSILSNIELKLQS